MTLSEIVSFDGVIQLNSFVNLQTIEFSNNKMIGDTRPPAYEIL